MANDIEMIPIEDLLLDPDNPRLPESLARDQQSMIDYIAQTTSIEELMEAIGQNDYFLGEPLIAVRTATAFSPSQCFVVEGNRRLTALKLLASPGASTQSGSRIRAISEHAVHRPLIVPVLVRRSRAEILPYLGFRHITGVKQWDPLAKARYIEQLFNDPALAAHTAKARYGEVASAIGSRRDHIKRNLDALAVYKLIRDDEFYGIENLGESTIKFAVLSTALADDRIGEFVGLTQKQGDGEPQLFDPIVDATVLHRKPIEELTRWLFQLENNKTRVGESRNLRLLSAVVGNDRALTALRNGSSLQIAYQLTADVTQDFAVL